MLDTNQHFVICDLPQFSCLFTAEATLYPVFSFLFFSLCCRSSPGASVTERKRWYTKKQTSVGWNINDPVAVHPGFWNYPVNGGRRVSDIREADARW